MKTKFIGLSCLLLAFVVDTTRSERTRPPKIAIIGGGIGGTSCSFFLRQFLGDEAHIHIFEKQPMLGGRLATFEFSGDRYETGGSIIHARNRYMSSYADAFGLKKRKSEETDLTMGIFDGHQFVFKESSWSLVTLLKMLLRYGMDLWHIQKSVDAMLTDFENIYKHQNNGYAFTTVSKLLHSMNYKFVENLHKAFDDYLIKEKFSRRFADELANAAVRVNYGQNLNVTAFVGTVALAGAEKGLWSVVGGNRLVAEAFYNHSKSVLHHCDVDTVARIKMPDGSYSFNLSCKQKNEHFSDYDAVVLAHPMVSGQSGIHFNGFEIPSLIYGPYYSLHVTFVAGRLKTESFHCEPSFFNTCPEEILLCSKNNDMQWLNSVGIIKPVQLVSKDGKQVPVYKVFSTAKLTKQQMEFLFSTVEHVHSLEWFAYPDYVNGGFQRKEEPFELAQGVFHINAIEWAASAMEMSVIGAKNVALLVSHYLQKQGVVGQLSISIKKDEFVDQKTSVKDEF